MALNGRDQKCGVSSFAIIDVRDGSIACLLSRKISRWFAARGKRTLLLATASKALTRNARRLSDVMDRMNYLDGAPLEGYLSHGDGISEVMLDARQIDDPIIGSFARNFDLLLFVFGKDVLDIEFVCSVVPPALILVPAPDGSDRPNVGGLVEDLLKKGRRPRPSGFAMEDGDRLAESRLARRLHIPSWGGTDNVGHLSQKIMEGSSGHVVGGADGTFMKNDPDKLYADSAVENVVKDVMKSVMDDERSVNLNDAGASESLRNAIASKARQKIPSVHCDAEMKFDFERIVEHVVDETIGYGPLETLLKDQDITEIMVNGYDKIYVEKNGVLEAATQKFRSDDHLLSVIERIVAMTNRRIDESSPMVDARLPDGSRLNAVIRPVSIDGPSLTIRRFIQRIRCMDDLVAGGMLSADSARFLMDCVRGKASIVISGGTGSGKTTLLGILASAISPDERVITIEDAAELCLATPHVVRLEARPRNIEGAGEITIRDLVKNALRMRPDRIVVGECRGPEALDMLQAMNTGHEGSLTSVHANSPRDAVARLETMVLMAGVDLPLFAVREQIVRSVDLIVQVARLDGGARRVIEVAELTGMEGNTPCMQTVASFDSSKGGLALTGLKPRFLERSVVLNSHP